jgi:hypothetical protein
MCATIGRRTSNVIDERSGSVGPNAKPPTGAPLFVENDFIREVKSYHDCVDWGPVMGRAN